MSHIAIKLCDSGHTAIFEGEYDDTQTSDRKVFVLTNSNHSSSRKLQVSSTTKSECYEAIIINDDLTASFFNNQDEVFGELIVKQVY